MTRSDPSTSATGWVRRFAGGLRFPVLFAIAAALFLIDLIVPDVIPLADEILLALITVMLGALRRKGRAVTRGR